MKRILTSFALVAASVAFSQVSVSGDENHAPEATLDVKAIGGDATADGVLIPRVDRLRAQNMPNVKHSTLIYVDDITKGAQSGKANQIDAKGFYYFDTEVGTSGEWVKLGGGASAAAPQTWRDIRTAPNATGVEGGIHKVSTNGETIPATAFLVITDLTGQTSIRLPNPADEAIKPGKMIVVSKIGTGSTAVLDHDGITGHAPGSKLLTDGGIYAFRGKVFITDGEFWYTLNY